MTDMSSVIIPKSDQLNSDDLISGPRTITITDVSVRPGTEQPVAISFDGDNGKPYKPCKSMCRVMVSMWGPDAGKYTGRSLTLYRDPTVTWAGMQVGGIRISHMSHIVCERVMALTVTKQSRRPFTVKPLRAESERPAESASAPTEPEATSPAGREWTKAEAEKRGKEIAAVLRDHGNSVANLSYSWQLNEAEIMGMPVPVQRGLRTVYETEMAALEKSAGVLDPEQGRVEDERQEDLLP